MKEFLIVMLVLVIVLVVSRVGYELGYQEFQANVKEVKDFQAKVKKQLIEANKIVEEAEEYKRRVMR